MRVTGGAMIFAKDFDNGRSYSTSVGRRLQDGTYENMFIQVNFRKDVVVEDRTKIKILDGFLSFYKNKNGLCFPKIVILSFETVEDNEELDNQIMSDEDLPF